MAQVAGAGFGPRLQPEALGERREPGPTAERGRHEHGGHLVQQAQRERVGDADRGDAEQSAFAPRDLVGRAATAAGGGPRAGTRRAVAPGRPRSGRRPCRSRRWPSPAAPPPIPVPRRAHRRSGRPGLRALRARIPAHRRPPRPGRCRPGPRRRRPGGSRAGADPSARDRGRRRRWRPRAGRGPRRRRRRRAPGGRCPTMRGARSTSAWFTTRMSAPLARSRACSAKQLSPSLHFAAPGHSRGAQLAARREPSAMSTSVRSPVADSSANRSSRSRSRASVGPGRSSSVAWPPTAARSFARHTYCDRPLSSAAVNETPPCSRRWGRSLFHSWSCNVSVAVDTTTRRPEVTAAARYASPLPDPVGASATRWCSPSIASATAAVRRCWPGRSSPPRAATAAESTAPASIPRPVAAARAGLVVGVSVIPRLSRVRGYVAAGTGSAEATGRPSLHNWDETAGRSRENPRKIRHFGGRPCKAGQQPSPFPKESQ